MELYKNWNNYKIKKKLTVIIESGRLDNKEIYLFGVSLAKIKIRNCIERNGYKVQGILDNDPDKYSKKWMGIWVEKPENLSIHKNIFILVYGHEKAKRRQLLNLGFVEEKQFTVIKEFETSTLSLGINNLIDLINGYHIYSKLRKGNKSLIVCPYAGSGDAYLTGLYINQYISQNSIKNYSIIVCGGVFKKVLSLFTDNDIAIINKEDMDKLRYLISVLGERNLNIYYMLYWGLYGQYAFMFEGYKGLTFHKIFKRCVFNFDEHIRPDMITQTISYQEAVNRILDLGLNVGKTVVLAPYANSFVNELSLDWWEELASHLKKNGYTVCTNSSGEKEPVIPGTVGVLFSYSEIIRLIEACGTFVGIRSGLCDIISSANCNKIIIYQDFMTERRAEFFSLNRMELCKDAFEIKYRMSEDNKAEFLNKILKRINFAK